MWETYRKWFPRRKKETPVEQEPKKTPTGEEASFFLSESSLSDLARYEQEAKERELAQKLRLHAGAKQCWWSFDPSRRDGTVAVLVDERGRILYSVDIDLNVYIIPETPVLYDYAEQVYDDRQE
jgi:hypothetical protein